MESSVANQLPEVGSLPDGFVESSAESMAPLPPVSEQEESLRDYKEDNYCLLECASGSENQSLVQLQTDSIVVTTENAERIRTFPVTLSEKDSSRDSAEVEQEVDKDCLQVIEGNSAAPELSDSIRQVECSNGKEHGEHQDSGGVTEGGVSIQATNAGGISPTESVDISKTKKETTEVKRKNAKRTFKSEKEFLEFTLSYQQILAERDAAITVRDKLESLCRELQRQNKMLMDECKRASTEGQNLRLDISTRFEVAIKDVSIKLEEQKDECLVQLKENEMLRCKLKEFADQYTLCEQKFAQKLKQKTLELQLADLKIKQHEEKLVQEQSQMKLYAEQVSQLLTTEKNLRLQLTADGEKFQQFQDALIKSNEVFESFKKEIEKMGKSIKELKKENAFLKSKSEKSDVTLIELVEERERLKKQLEKSRNQKEMLESLCRSLQAERKHSSTGSNSSDSVPV